MTGDAWCSPYFYGQGAFQSVNLFEPKIGAVLFHPWHGLLIYHPFYLVGFVSLVGVIVEAFKQRDRERLIYSSAVVVGCVCLLWVVASKPAWWMGRWTFGQRGLAQYSVLLIPVFIDYLQITRWRWVWITVAIVSSLWSLPLLWLGHSNFSSYYEFLPGYREGVRQFVIAHRIEVTGFLALMLGAWAWSCKTRFFSRCLCVSGLAFPVACYLIERLRLPLAIIPWIKLSLPPVMMLLLWIIAREREGRYEVILTRMVQCGQCTIALVAVAMAALFFYFAHKSETEIALGGVKDLKRFQYRSDVHVVAIMDCLREYESLPGGFEEDWRKLRDYVVPLEQVARIRPGTLNQRHPEVAK